MSNLDRKYVIDLFVKESIDRLEELSHTLLELENEPTNMELIKILFRTVHTIKGSATTTFNTITPDDTDPVLQNVKHIGEVTHDLESLMTEVRENSIPITENIIDLLFETESMIETLLSYVDQEIEEELDVSDICHQLKQFTEPNGDSPTKEVVIDSFLFPETHHAFEVELSSPEGMKYAIISMFYSDLKLEYEDIVLFPSVDDLTNGASVDRIFFAVPTIHTKKDVISLVTNLENVEDVFPYANDAGEYTADSTLTAKTKNPEPTSNTTSTSKPTQTRTTPLIHKHQDLRVPIIRIDEVLKHVSNLVILKNKLSTTMPSLQEENAKVLKEISEEMSQTIDFLQESVIKIRMTPLNQLFGRFPKDVRNVAKEFDKKVNFQYIGGETEIDNSLIERLYDPLIHLVRNSIFHGLESEEERIQKGKEPIGQLTLQAKHEEGWVVISIEDDGKGIDVDKVTNKAIANGMITREKANELSDDELIQLIFASGLSTAEKVNNFAGRGVGMDVVRTEIEDMKGSVHVYSKKDKGTKIVLRLPLTLAIIHALLADVNGESFAFPISQIEEVIEIEKKQIKYASKKEIFLHREQEIPIIHLRQFFGLSTEIDYNQLTLIILKSGDRLVAVSVDDATKNEDIVVKNIGKYLGEIPGISGCTILGDGTISLIVDVNNMVKHISLANLLHDDTPTQTK